jgi:hypothetical protein
MTCDRINLAGTTEETVKTYWQAETYRNDEIHSIDFPRRQTREEAEQDAQESLIGESCDVTAGVAEWIGDDESSESTGQRFDVPR